MLVSTLISSSLEGLSCEGHARCSTVEQSVLTLVNKIANVLKKIERSLNVDLVFFQKLAF